MTDGPMTATEVRARERESFKRHSLTPDFSGALSDLLRRLRRAALRVALKGSSEDRYAYCIYRASAKPMTNLTCYGSALYDPKKLSELAARWFFRLERLAKKDVG